MKTLLVLYDQRYPEYWKDGFWAAVGLLGADYEVTWHNVLTDPNPPTKEFDLLLARGNWGGIVDKAARQIVAKKKTLYICGNVSGPEDPHFYDVLFYENSLQRGQLKAFQFDDDHLIHAFGVNTEINRPMELPKVIDYLSVGAFSLWKRQEMLLDKEGVRLVVGEVQQDNLPESMAIIDRLVQGGVGVMGMVPPETLAVLYNLSKKVYIPADITGGGERAVQEAMACGVPVEIEGDNWKLAEFVTDGVYDHNYMYQQLKKGLQ